MYTFFPADRLDAVRLALMVFHLTIFNRLELETTAINQNELYYRHLHR